MRHIVVFDPEAIGWAVVDTESAHMVVSFHESRQSAKAAAANEEQSWPAHRRTVHAQVA
ncbi:MAG: hypothetical protein HN403_00915 [Rhodospirillales bacterium]|jgi:hypothetical protein|nr:hypothetical protein [Rhodospirillales bacterium]